MTDAGVHIVTVYLDNERVEQFECARNDLTYRDLLALVQAQQADGDSPGWTITQSFTGPRLSAAQLDTRAVRDDMQVQSLHCYCLWPNAILPLWPLA